MKPVALSSKMATEEPDWKSEFQRLQEKRSLLEHRLQTWIKNLSNNHAGTVLADVSVKMQIDYEHSNQPFGPSVTRIASGCLMEFKFEQNM